LASYTNGPDVTDLQAVMRAVGALNSGEVKVTITPRTGSVSGGLHVVTTITLTPLPGSSLPATISAECDWPTQGHSDFVGFLWAGIVALDGHIEKTYNQLPLPA